MHGLLAGSPEAAALARSEGTRMSAMHTLWPLWGIALLFALAGRNESASILAALPWWHRAMGATAAVAFFTGYLWRLIGHQ
jgi:hypothetical protein